MFETKQGTIKPIVYVGMVKGGKLLLVEYVEAPNPAKQGWWIPAPGLEFGACPQETAEKVVGSLGFASDKVKLHDVESFTLPGGWHLIHHYVAEVEGEPAANPNIKGHKWVSAEELAEMKDIAHGRWEIGVGKSYLGAAQ